MKKVILFDCDGVLVDTEMVAVKVAQRILKEKGLNISLKRASDFVGKTDVDFFMRIKKDFPTKSLKTLLSDFRYAYIREIKQDVKPISGVVRLIKRLHKNHTIGLVSGSRRNQIRIILDSLNIRSFFSVVVSQEDCHHFKPNSDPYLVATRKLGVKPSVCTVIEDSQAGVHSAKSAGMRVIALRHPYIKQNLKEADIIIQNFKQLKETML